jgi:pyrroloquinoline quinone biosynthesis protein D
MKGRELSVPSFYVSQELGVGQRPGGGCDMLENVPIKLSDRPEIDPLYLFRWEEKEQAYLLLYPEGIIKLNDSAGNILKLCTGERTFEEVILELKKLFGADDLDEDIYNFMEVAIGKGWIRVKT